MSLKVTSNNLRKVQEFPVNEIQHRDCNHFQKILEKLRKLRKSCNHKRNINRIYNEKVYYNFLQQLLTLRLRTLGN